MLFTALAGGSPAAFVTTLAVIAIIRELRIAILRCPVELIDFTAERLGREVWLHWRTASEIDNDYFTLERGVDGREFASIGIVEGQSHCR